MSFPTQQYHRTAVADRHITDSAEQRGLPTPLQSYIHTSRYARWLDSVARLGETVKDRAVSSRTASRQSTPSLALPKPSAICMLCRQCVALRPQARTRPRRNGLYNCAAPQSTTSVPSTKSYMYSCASIQTPGSHRSGDKRIADIVVGDEVLSLDEHWRSCGNAL